MRSDSSLGSGLLLADKSGEEAGYVAPLGAGEQQFGTQGDGLPDEGAGKTLQPIEL